MAQIGAQMVGMTMTESVQHMQAELESMGIDECHLVHQLDRHKA